MKNWNRKLALALTLCFTLALGMSAFAEGVDTAAPVSTVADAASTSNQESQYEDAGNTPIAIAVTTEQAIQIVKDQLKADDTWTVEVVEMNEENGVMTYKVIATNAMNDACCRLVNAATGEMTSVNLWLESNDPQKDDNEDSEGKKGDSKDKKKDGKKSADDQSADNADNNDNAGDNNDDSTDAGEANNSNADETDNGGNAVQDAAQAQN
ncbi:MAG: hypothetical protein PHY12_01665 [Eubacteriales bacterium]|nr:hypothetical protein [Eubacteriales bacterium]